MKTVKDILQEVLNAVNENENDLNNIPIEPLKNLLSLGIRTAELGIISTKIPLVLQPFDGFEVQPCKEIEPEIIEVCEPHEADFWSAYYHLTAGGVDCIADFETQEQANTFIEFLESVVKFNRMQKPIELK